MSIRPAPGRRPDSLFDNRYRIDHVYPRGRSGEVLRAFDTLNDDLPVVIKRPALQDAPPMRAGQEQNILNEKRALERLAGHVSVTQLRYTGLFRVGGQPYHFIVLDEAPGESLETMVTRLALSDEYLPELEMLVIFDKLLDVIQAAHDRKMIYNNTDPTNLYWDRDTYMLKVMGWENAVLQDTDVVQPGIGHTTDILQTGQLIYFVASGGRRLDLGRTDVLQEMGVDVPMRLKQIVSRAANPEPSQRYAAVVTLRQELDELRRPLERERNALVERIKLTLPDLQSPDELNAVRAEIEEALVNDPGYPEGHVLLTEVDARIKALLTEEDLHAVGVYMSSGNMVRASAVLAELKARTGSRPQPVLDYLLDVCAQLQAEPVIPLAAGLTDALGALLEGDLQTAGRILVTTQEPRPAARIQQFMLAERLSLYMPDVVLLRPPLALMESSLATKSGAAVMRDILRAIQIRLDRPVALGIQALRGLYQETVSSLQEFEAELAPLNGNGDQTLMESAARARAAAERILYLIDLALACLLREPEAAAAAFASAGAIDPANSSFAACAKLVNIFQADVNSLREFTPSADGQDIAPYVSEAQTRLQPYVEYVTDPQFQTIVRGLDEAAAAWTRLADMIALGGRGPAVAACQHAAESTRTLNAPLAEWLDKYTMRIEQAPLVAELSTNTALGAALEAGWDLWDRGRAAEAQAAGDQAMALATTDGERRAARRLVNISEVLNTWLTNDGPLDSKRTDQAEERVNELLLPEEETIRRKFSKQMPDAQIYLRAMVKGIVGPMRETSAAGVRALFLHYVLRGMLALHDANSDPKFWHEAALRTLPSARAHPAYQALDAAIARRTLVEDAVRTLNNVTHTADLAPARQAARAPLAAAQLEAADQAMHAVDTALKAWSEGQFKVARQSIDTAAERISFAETVLGKDLAPFKTWLQDLGASAELLYQARRSIEQAALVPADDPNPVVSEAYHKIVEITRRDLGESYAAGLREWRDVYNAIRDLYVDVNLSKAEKQRLYEAHAATPTFEEQPALPILRHWAGIIKRLPEPLFKNPFRGQGHGMTEGSDYAPPSEIIDIPDPDNPDESESALPPISAVPAPEPIHRTSPIRLIVGAVVVLALIAGAVFLLLQTKGGNAGAGIPLTAQVSLPTSQSPLTAQAVAIGTTPTDTDTSTPELPTATFTEAFTSTPPTLPPTITRAVPTYTPTLGTPATNVPGAPSFTPTHAPTLGAGVIPGVPGSTAIPTNGSISSPTPAATAKSGDYDMLELLATLPTNKITWNKDWFGPGGDGWQLGTDAPKPNSPPLVVRLGPEIMTPLIGSDASRKLTRVDATLELVSYDKTQLPSGNVFYGFGLESSSGQRISVRAVLVQTSIARLGIDQNGLFHQKTEIPAATLKTQITIMRNTDGTLTLLVDGQQLGLSNPSYAPGSPLGIYMYTSSGGVIVKMTALSLHLG